MKNLFIISTPSHYFNLLECIEEFNFKTNDSDILFLNSNSHTSNEMISNFIDKYVVASDWNNLIRIELWDTKNSSLFSTKNFKIIIQFVLKIFSNFLFKSYENVTTSQIDQFYFRFINTIIFSKNIIALDEGNAIFKILENRKKSSALNLLNNITFFTSYDVKIDQNSKDKIIKCNYSYSKRIIKKCNVNNNELFFIGSPYLEDNLVEEKIYWDYMYAIRDYYSNFHVTYFSHRRESEKNLTKIRNKFNFSCKTLDLPIELYFLKIESMPEIISGFSSAAIFNLRKMTIESPIKFDAHCIDFNSIKNSHSDKLELVFEDYKKNNINIINLLD